MSQLALIAARWRSEHDASAERILAATIGSAPTYQSLDQAMLRASISAGITIWQDLFETGDERLMRERAARVGQARAAARIDIAEVMVTSDVFRAEIWRMMREHFRAGWDPDAVEQIERWLHIQRTEVVAAYGAGLTAALGELDSREQQLAQQSALIRTLSTPIIPIHTGVLALPLVGAIDDGRAAQVMEAALERIVEQQADILILDITGVPLVDLSVADHLVRLARAARLLGAHVIMVGVGATIAQTMVQLGVDLGEIETAANLQAGLALALRRLGGA